MLAVSSPYLPPTDRCNLSGQINFNLSELLYDTRNNPAQPNSSLVKTTKRVWKGRTSDRPTLLGFVRSEAVMRKQCQNTKIYEEKETAADIWLPTATNEQSRLRQTGLMHISRWFSRFPTNSADAASITAKRINNNHSSRNVTAALWPDCCLVPD